MLWIGCLMLGAMIGVVTMCLLISGRDAE